MSDEVRGMIFILRTFCFLHWCDALSAGRKCLSKQNQMSAGARREMLFSHPPYYLDIFLTFFSYFSLDMGKNYSIM